jgi:hypothetical protein
MHMGFGTIYYAWYRLLNKLEVTKIFRTPPKNKLSLLIAIFKGWNPDFFMGHTGIPNAKNQPKSGLQRSCLVPSNLSKMKAEVKGITY